MQNSTSNVLNSVSDKFKNEYGNLKICFLLTHIPNPRMNKRIEFLKQKGLTQVICVRRASQNIWEPTQDVEHTVYDIDLPSAKHIVKRYISSQEFQKKALDKLNEIKPNVIYAEGLDTLIIASQYKKNHDVRILFEVADLRENYIVKPKKFIKRLITRELLRKEKTVFKNVDFLVVTSPKFYDMHYKSLISKNRLLFIPNAPNIEVFKYYKKHEGEFTVGFIGGIRYLHQMKMLVDVSEKIPCNVLFAGAGGTSSDYAEIQNYCSNKENVTFTGRYDYNSQIASLYGKVDCVFAVYDADNSNVRIALPNKLYESIYCELPIIVAKGTYLSELVEKYGVGISVSHKNSEELEKAIMQLKTDKEYYDLFVENCRNTKEKLLKTSDENKLKNVLSS